MRNRPLLAAVTEGPGNAVGRRAEAPAECGGILAVFFARGDDPPIVEVVLVLGVERADATACIVAVSVRQIVAQLIELDPRLLRRACNRLAVRPARYAADPVFLLLPLGFGLVRVLIRSSSMRASCSARPSTCCVIGPPLRTAVADTSSIALSASARAWA